MILRLERLVHAGTPPLAELARFFTILERDHPDHYFGLAVIRQAFPKAKLVARPAAVAEIRKTAKAKVGQWSPMYGALIPSEPVLPVAST